MGNIPVVFLPPQDWQVFEKMLRGIVDVIWEQYGWQNYGRPGQSQSGIDIFGYNNSRQFVGIQCKKKSQTNSEGVILSNSLLTKTLIESEIRLAEKIINPSLDKLIFATTSSRDKGVQDFVRSVNDKRIEAGKFTVDIWFWEDIQVHIENHSTLKIWYYSDLLIDIHQYDKDFHILSMLKQAFTRPAFSREMHREESGADFLLAIKNTQEAITTGKLYNRRGDLITTSFSYDKITKNEWRLVIGQIYDDLENIRNIYQDGIRTKSIKEHPTCLEIYDDSISLRFNKLRKSSLIMMNEILADAKIEVVKSELLG